MDKLNQALEEATTAVGRFACALTWLIEAGEIILDSPELELTQDDVDWLAEMHVGIAERGGLE